MLYAVCFMLSSGQFPGVWTAAHHRHKRTPPEDRPHLASNSGPMHQPLVFQVTYIGCHTREWQNDDCLWWQDDDCLWVTGWRLSVGDRMTTVCGWQNDDCLWVTGWRLSVRLSNRLCNCAIQWQRPILICNSNIFPGDQKIDTCFARLQNAQTNPWRWQQQTARNSVWTLCGVSVAPHCTPVAPLNNVCCFCCTALYARSPTPRTHTKNSSVSQSDCFYINCRADKHLFFSLIIEANYHLFVQVFDIWSRPT
jgi:hypothetical protein